MKEPSRTKLSTGLLRIRTEIRELWKKLDEIPMRQTHGNRKEEWDRLKRGDYAKLIKQINAAATRYNDLVAKEEKMEKDK
jgi:hypothetical protein